VQQSVTEEVVKRALFARAVGEAPGLDRKSFGAVCLLCSCQTKRSVEQRKAVN
jgi:hypothetical protein